MLIQLNECAYIPKDWGYELVVRNDELYCIKQLHIAPGRQCSYHYHRIKTETFHVLRGTVTVEYAPVVEFGPPAGSTALLTPQLVVLGPGDYLHLPAGTRHRFSAEREATILEISTQHRDADVVRLVPGGPIDDQPLPTRESGSDPGG